MFQTKVCTENQNTHFIFYEILKKNSCIVGDNAEKCNTAREDTRC